MLDDIDKPGIPSYEVTGGVMLVEKLRMPIFCVN
jgi:hypothetical protein